MVKMIKQHKRVVGFNRLPKPAISVVRWALIFGVSAAVAESVQLGQAVTGKIVIDGVVYGEGGAQMAKGSGEFGRQTRQMDAFHSVKILGGVDVDYRQEPRQRIEVIGDSNLLPLINMQVSQGVLTVGSNESYQVRLPLTVQLSASELKALAMYGAGDIMLAGLDEASLRLDLNGSGDVKVEGKVGYFSINLTGSSDVDAEDLISEQAEVRLTGSGDVDLTVKRLLKVQVLGSGDVTYYGNPEKIQKQIIGSGDLRSGD
ncbi:MAG: head GIN domain-containing protein [Gammaproteobacteria bacterium]